MIRHVAICIGAVLLSIPVFGVSTVITGCTSTVTQPSEVIFPDSNVSYVRNMQAFLSLSCAYSGCHGDANAAGGIRLTSYSNMMFDRGNMVIPGKPDESLLYMSIDGTIPHPYDVMAKVTENQRKGVRTWILEGGQNN